MDIRDKTVDAIILKAKDYKENDKLLIYYSLEHGKGAAIARGAGKPGGSLRSIAQPFSRVSLTLSAAKGGLSYVNQGMPVTSFITLDASLSTIAYASYIGELVDISVHDHRPSVDLFALLLAVFSMIKLDDDHQRTARLFELRLLKELGLLPDLSECAECGRRLIGADFRLSPRQGRLLCLSCAKDDPAPVLCAGAVQTMKKLLNTDLVKLASIKINNQLMKEIEASLTYFMDYHMDFTSKAKRVLKQLLD